MKSLDGMEEKLLDTLLAQEIPKAQGGTVPCPHCQKPVPVGDPAATDRVLKILSLRRQYSAHRKVAEAL